MEPKKVSPSPIKYFCLWSISFQLTNSLSRLHHYYRAELAGQSGPGNWEKLGEYERPTLIDLRSPVPRPTGNFPVSRRASPTLSLYKRIHVSVYTHRKQFLSTMSQWTRTTCSNKMFYRRKQFNLYSQPSHWRWIENRIIELLIPSQGHLVDSGRQWYQHNFIGSNRYIMSKTCHYKARCYRFAKHQNIKSCHRSVVRNLHLASCILFNSNLYRQLGIAVCHGLYYYKRER